MGLNCSHGAFDGAYSAFNRLRQIVCQCIGGSYPPHYKKDAKGFFLKDEYGYYVNDFDIDNNQFFVPTSIEKEEYAGIWEFLLHSDCDGYIEPEMCLKVAEDLEKLVLPNIDNFDLNANGHILAQGGYKEVLLKFIKGCKLAAKRKQKLRFR